jgi:hypothetical protein
MHDNFLLPETQEREGLHDQTQASSAHTFPDVLATSHVGQSTNHETCAFVSARCHSQEDQETDTNNAWVDHP